MRCVGVGAGSGEAAARKRLRGVELLAAAALFALIIDLTVTAALSFYLSFLVLAEIMPLRPCITLHLPGILPSALRGAARGSGTAVHTPRWCCTRLRWCVWQAPLPACLLIPLTALFLLGGTVATAADAISGSVSRVHRKSLLGVLYSALVVANRMFSAVLGIKI